MIMREMLDIQTPICKVCKGALGRIMVYRKDYKGHLYFCHDCGTEYKIVGQGQSDIELEVEYDNGMKYLVDSKVIPFGGTFEPGYVQIKEKEDE